MTYMPYEPRIGSLEQYADSTTLEARAKIYREHSFRNTSAPSLRHVIREQLALWDEASVLDIGSGPGHTLGGIWQSGHHGRLCGIDLSPGMVASAKSNYPKIDFQIGDATDLPFPDESFNRVTAMFIFYLIPDKVKSLHEIYRVLQPNGRFIRVGFAPHSMQDYWNVVVSALSGLSAFQPLVRYMKAEIAEPSDGSGQMKTVFDEVQTVIIDAGIRFPTPELAVAFFTSHLRGFVDESHWIEGQDRVYEAAIQQCLNGPWIVSRPFKVLLGLKAAVGRTTGTHV
jgi:ubiquinone/menaquinone biosynthesis C-methylase UbiE